MQLSHKVSVRRAALGAALAIATAAGGCSNDGSVANLFSTGSLSGTASNVAATKAPVDPMCVTLASQIETLKKEGAVDRLEKAADGKTANVNVQRASLAKQAQLNKTNADFIAKCGPALPQTAMVGAPIATASTAAAPAAAVKAVKSAAAKAAPAAAQSGVTVAAPSTDIPAAAAAAVAKAPVN